MSHLFVRVLLAAAAVCALLPLASARAGDYRVFICKDAAGNSIPLDGSWTPANHRPYSAAAEGCAGNAAIGIFMGSFVGQPSAVGYSNGVAASWSWTPPLGALQLKSLTLRRSVQMRAIAGDSNGTPTFEAWTSGPGLASTRHEFCAQSLGCPGIGLGDVTYGIPAGTTKLDLFAQCGGTGSCANDVYGERVIASIQRIEAVVTDPEAPFLIGGAGGTLLDAGGLTGSRTLTLAAQDGESGLSSVIVRIDNAVVATGTPPGRTAECNDLGQRSEPDYRTLVPCPKGRQDLAITVPTAGIANGTKRLLVDLVDASGNQRTVVDRQITIAHPAPPTPQTPGTPSPGIRLPGFDANGSPVVTPGGTGPGGASLGGVSVALTTKMLAAKKSLAYGASFPVSGTLRTHEGKPAGNFELEVWEQHTAISRTWQPIPLGAGWQRTGSVTTDADGNWTVRPKWQSSKRIRVGLGDAFTEFAVPVRAKVTISGPKRAISRRGQLKLTGTVSLDGMPENGARIDIQVKEGKRWRGFESTRVSSKGRWTFKYRLRQGAGTFPFRARLKEAGDLPTARVTSSSIKVRLR